MTRRLTAIRCHPVKSCGGFEVPSWELDEFGLRYDRNLMVVDHAGVFLTQREVPELALVGTRIRGTDLVLTVPGHPPTVIPLDRPTGEPCLVSVWGDECRALDQGDAVAAHLSDHLGRECRLVRIPPGHRRAVDPAYFPAGAQTSFTDGYPLLLTTTASLADLNERLDDPLPMERFRPNLVVEGAGPFEEDAWRWIRIGSIEMAVVKACARCTITTVDQDAGRRAGPEPLRTLGTFRRGVRGVLFGQNLVHVATGSIAVGDPVEVLETVRPEP